MPFLALVRLVKTWLTFFSFCCSTTGVRDPITSALQIILGYKAPLDIAQVVRWKTRLSSVDVPFVRYAASFVGSASPILHFILDLGVKGCFFHRFQEFDSFSGIWFLLISIPMNVKYLVHFDKKIFQRLISNSD